jgi:1-acyl-sn-glycerol-3-phosphate acyltransferase
MYPLWYQTLMHRLWYPPVSTAMNVLFSVRTWGRQRVPMNGGLLVVANHQSFFDPVLVGMAVRRRLCYLARKTLFRNPLFSWLIRSFGAIPIDQEKPSLEGIRTALELLRRQEAVVLFPEGERTPHGQMQPLKPGVALLIRRGQVPVLPVAIAGAYEIWPRHSPLPILCPLWSRRRCRQTGAHPSIAKSVSSATQSHQPGRRGIAVVVGQPIPFADFENLPNEAILARLHQVLLDLFHQAEQRRFVCLE